MVDKNKGMTAMKKTILSIAMLTMLSGPAFAGSLDETIAALVADGYTISEVKKTLLGNYKIEARKGTTEREVVYSELFDRILRDKTDDENDDHSSTRKSNSASDDDSNDDGNDDNGNDDNGNDDNGNDDNGNDDHGSDDHGSDDN
jgi:hypothetical protein